MKVFLALLTIINFDLNGQSLTDSLKTTLLDKTFELFFEKKSDVEHLNNWYVVKDSLNDGLKTSYENFTLHFIKKVDIRHLNNRKLKEIHYANLHQLSKDTIDIYVYSMPIFIQRNWLLQKHVKFTISCGKGSLPNPPTARFIYSDDKMEWIHFIRKLTD